MKPIFKERLLNFMGFFFLAIALNQILIKLFFARNLVYLLWFSDHAPLVLGLGILFRKRIIVTAEMCIALIPESVWSLDFLWKILFNRYLFEVNGVANFLFYGGVLNTNWEVFSSIQHIFILPLGLAALFLMGSHKKGVYLAIGYGLVLWVFGFLSGNQYNINCVFQPCTSILPNFKGYMAIFPAASIILIVLSSIIIKKVIKPIE